MQGAGGGRAGIARSLRWDGRQPLAGYEFIVDDMKQTYTFFVPATRLAMATLDEQKMSGMARMMLTQGLMRGQMRGYMDGERADTHVAADSAFRFPFDPKSGGRTMTMADDDARERGRRRLSGGRDAATEGRGTREVLDQGHETRGAPDRSGKGSTAVEVVIENLTGGLHRVWPKKSLEPGENGFYLTTNGSASGHLYLFGVD